jgi:hypothetical protein
MHAILTLLLVIGASVCSTSAEAQKSDGLRPDRIQISYIPPKNPAHQPIYELLKQRQVLDRFKEFLSPLRLPRTLGLKTEGCDGEVNAWYEDDAIIVCYEYLDDILRNAPTETTPAGITRMDAIVGPIIETFLHEIGHAFFDYHTVPILGREEDAADQFAAYIMLQFQTKRDVRRLILGVAYAYNREASLPSLKKNPFADEHGLPAQRFYNVLCMAYGSDPKLFADVAASEKLPKERAEGCEYEYEQLQNAMKKLVGPYIDQARAKTVRAKRLLRFEEGKSGQ